MPKFYFKCTHEAEEGFAERTNTVSFEAETWDEVTSEMTDFLHACGYEFKGELEMVNQETAVECGGAGCKHSSFFFDFDRNR